LDYTARTREWLEGQFTRFDAEGRRLFHQPLFDVGDPRFEGKHLAGLARLAHVLRALDGLEVGSVLDVGAAEGLFAHAIRAVKGAEVVAGDAALEAALVARRELGLPALVLDSARLPFPDAAFDAVVCCEVLEHVEYPVETLLELLRVARVAVVVTTEECLTDRAEIHRRLFERSGYPHEERNLFHPDDLRAVLGERVELQAQMIGTYPTAPRDLAEARRYLLGRARPAGLPADGRGVVAVAVLDETARRARTLDDEELAERALVARRVPPPPADPGLPATLRTRLVCPHTGGSLEAGVDALVAPDGARYPVREGVPVMISAAAEEPTEQGTRARLAAARGAGAVNVDDALGVRARLAVPPALRVRAFDLTREAERRGWHPSPDLRPPEGDVPGLGGLAVGSDPGWTSPRLDVDDVAAVRVELAVLLPGSGAVPAVGQLYWLAADGVAFDEMQSTRFPVLADGGWRTQLVRLPSAVASVAWIRVDPCEVPAAVALRAVELLSSAELAALPPRRISDLRERDVRARWLASGDARDAAGGVELGPGGALTGPGPEVDAREVDGLELELTLRADAGEEPVALRLEWLGERDREPSPARTATLALSFGGAARFALGGLAAWRESGRVVWVRLSPAGGAARVLVSSLAWAPAEGAASQS
jgi:SAM-dependent methyltransferase/uncharacterized protein YbaR (Trm112 family)